MRSKYSIGLINQLKRCESSLNITVDMIDVENELSGCRIDLQKCDEKLNESYDTNTCEDELNNCTSIIDDIKEQMGIE